MPTIVCILTFISRIDFMLSLVEHEKKSLITLSPVSTAGISLAFWSLAVPFPGLAHSFTSCQLLMKGSLLYSKRIYSANGISRSFFSSHKCFFKTYKNAFKWNASNWDWIFQNYSSFVAASNLLIKSKFISFFQHGSKYYYNSHSSRLQT